MEAARSMLHSSNSPLWLWSESVKYAAYILKCISSKEKLKTPYELFFRIKPNVSNIKIFGSRTFILALGKERKKIDNKFLEGMLVGFDEDKMGYRVYVPSEKRIIVSSHVQIDENTMYSYNMENPVVSSLIDSPLDPFKERNSDQDDDMKNLEHGIENNSSKTDYEENR